MIGDSGVEGKAARTRAAQAAGGALDEGVRAGGVEHQVAEGSDATADRSCVRAAAGEAARAAGDRQRYLIAVIPGEQVTERIEHTHLDGRTDGQACRGVARLDAEAQMIG